ncbi:hypothetical protein CFPU101_45620 [Chroococcus sp. FPU101]|nr:hypothetical protein CFPU101_45620 [Chroococcus sp. FPU101]
MTGLSVAQAQPDPCPYQGVTAPSQETRTFEHQKLGFSFQLPANYKAIKPDSSTEVMVIDPASYSFTECIKKVGFENIPKLKGLHEDSLWPSISIFAQSGHFKHRADLMDAIRIRGPIELLGRTTISGQEAIVYLVETLQHEIQISFATPDQKNLITIWTEAEYQPTPSGRYVPSAIPNEQVFQSLLDTFKFSETVDNSSPVNVGEILKVKTFFNGDSDTKPPGQYLINKVDLPNQSLPLYIISQQMIPYVSACAIGIDRWVCFNGVYIPKKSTYQQILALGLTQFATLQPTKQWLNNMPCLQVSDRQFNINEIYCYDGNKYKEFTQKKK